MHAKCGAPAVGGNFPEKHAKPTHFQPTPGGVSSVGCTFQTASRINKLCFVQASHRILVLPPPLALTQTTPLRFPFGAGCSLRSRQPQRENARGSFACSPMVGGKTRMRQLVKKPPRPAPGRLPGHSQGGRAAGAAWGAPRPSGWARPRRRATWLCCCAPIHVCGAGGRRAVPSALSPAAAGFCIAFPARRGAKKSRVSGPGAHRNPLRNAKPRGARGGAKPVFWGG